jgi:hypothetical protein
VTDAVRRGNHRQPQFGSDASSTGRPGHTDYSAS